eukprot:TRINITY_DN2008_c0_g1_i2.p1 TRINITY_DN2008_c0_g1~~TRINITY_DN2008_c0_g1_i2.p1  ORF type:complete len:228 (+),score=25.19 TRINITY_DN2008_c0_g1_i2:96-779(+)
MFAQTWRDEEEEEIDSDCEYYINSGSVQRKNYLDLHLGGKEHNYNEQFHEYEPYASSGIDQHWFDENELLEAFYECHRPNVTDPYYSVRDSLLEITFLAPNPITIPQFYFYSPISTANFSPLYSLLQQLQHKPSKLSLVQILHLLFDCFESIQHFTPTFPSPLKRRRSSKNIIAKEEPNSQPLTPSEGLASRPYLHSLPEIPPVKPSKVKKRPLSIKKQLHKTVVLD